MFDLEQAIAGWRKQMAAGGIKDSSVLDELESHLREDVAHQMQSGLTPQAAFEVAAGRIGRPGALQNEFVTAGANQETRLQWLKSAFLSFIGVQSRSPHIFTTSARKTLELGGKEALGFHHDFVGTEHVLLGLLGLETGAISSVLQKLGVDRRVVRSEIERIVGSGPVLPAISDTLRYTPRVKKALKLAGREAKAHRHPDVSAEHIFLGLLLEGGGVAAMVLKNLGVNIQMAREETLSELGRNQSAA